jgi:hypothetical protein
MQDVGLSGLRRPPQSADGHAAAVVAHRCDHARPEVAVNRVLAIAQDQRGSFVSIPIANGSFAEDEEANVSCCELGGRCVEQRSVVRRVATSCAQRQRERLMPQSSERWTQDGSIDEVALE